MFAYKHRLHDYYCRTRTKDEGIQAGILFSSRSYRSIRRVINRELRTIEQPKIPPMNSSNVQFEYPARSRMVRMIRDTARYHGDRGRPVHTYIRVYIYTHELRSFRVECEK